jgi:hypothetical protein
VEHLELVLVVFWEVLVGQRALFLVLDLAERLVLALEKRRTDLF